MEKAVLTVGYTKYVLDMQDALTVARLLNHAERIETKGYGDERAFFAWHDDKLAITELQFLSEDTYRVAKLAGRPSKD